MGMGRKLMGGGLGTIWMIRSSDRLDMVRRSYSPYNSPIFAVPKKDKDAPPRIVQDFRHINEAIESQAYPITRIDDAIEALVNQCIFTTLDLNTSFFQVELEEESKPLTAFSTRSGHWEMNVMPMGLKNSSFEFQNMINLVLVDEIWKICIVYIDDIIVFGKTFKEMIQNLRIILRKLKENNLTCKLEKCNFGYRVLIFLGYKITENGILPDDSNVVKIKEFQSPSLSDNPRKATRRFLGMTQMYSRFIKNYTDIAQPLLDLIPDHIQFTWNEECDVAFEALKQKLISAPVLAFPDFTKRFSLTTDASGYGLGAVLEQDGHPVAYISRKLTSAETRYSTSEKECLALIWAFEKFRVYLIDKEFDLYTDHKALLWLETMQKNRKLINWAIVLSEYDYKIHHRPGVEIANADCLSRCFLIMETQVDSEEIQLLKKLQKEDTEIMNLILDETSKQVYYTKINDLIYRITNDKQQLMVPQVAIPRILLENHDTLLGSHIGINNMMKTIKNKYYWSTIKDDCRSWISSCLKCQKFRLANKKIGELESIVIGEPFELVAMDIVGPLPKTSDGYQYILVISDYMTRWPEAIPLKNITAESVAISFVYYWISRFGIPLFLLTDQGSNFMSYFFKEICEIMNIKKLNTTAYHPQTDGLVERFNQTICHYLRNYLNEYQNNWDVILPFALMTYRNREHSSTKFSPAEVLYGLALNITSDPILEEQLINYDSKDYRDILESQLYDIRKQSIQNDIQAKFKQKTNYDKNALDAPDWNPGDLVFLWTPTVKKGQVKKFSEKYRGPFVIEEKISDLKYKLQLPDGKISKIVNVNRLKKYNQSELREILQIEDLELEELEEEDTFSFITNDEQKLLEQMNIIKDENENKSRKPELKEIELFPKYEEKPENMDYEMDDLLNIQNDLINLEKEPELDLITGNEIKNQNPTLSEKFKEAEQNQQYGRGLRSRRNLVDSNYVLFYKNTSNNRKQRSL